MIKLADLFLSRDLGRPMTGKERQAVHVVESLIREIAERLAEQIYELQLKKAEIDRQLEFNAMDQFTIMWQQSSEIPTDADGAHR